MYRFGSTAEVWSRCVIVTSAGFPASAFFVTNIRPELVPAHTTVVRLHALARRDLAAVAVLAPNGYGAGHGTLVCARGLSGGQGSPGPYVSRPGGLDRRLPGSRRRCRSNGSYVPFSFEVDVADPEVAVLLDLRVPELRVDAAVVATGTCARPSRTSA